MKRTLTTFVLVATFMALVSCSSTGGLGSMLGSLTNQPMVSSLMEKLGLSSNQAIGGLGSLLSLAKGTLSSDQFKQLASVIPSADKYMGALEGLGITGSDIKDAAGLQSAFSKLGMNQEQASGFVPTVSDLVGEMGGDSVKGLLSGLGV